MFLRHRLFIRRSFYLPLVFSFLLASCASMPEKMQNRINEGNPAEAVSMGEEYLANKPYDRDAWKIRELIREADYKITTSKDTLEAYTLFENKYSKEEIVVHVPAVSPQVSETSGKHKAKKAKKAKKRARKEQHEDEDSNSTSENPPDLTPQKSAMRVRRALPSDFMERKSRAYYREVTIPAGSAAAAREFQSSFPESPLVREASQRELSLAWEEAVKTNTIAAWKIFRASYSNHPRVTEALKLETDLAWVEAKGKGTEAALASFAKGYPDSSFASEATEKLCLAAWQEAQKTNNIGGYKKFVKANGNCKAQIAIARQKEEQLAWDDTTKKNTWDAYHEFGNNYPLSPNIREAEKRRQSLYAFSGPTGKNEYNTSVTSIDDRDPNNIKLYAQVIEEDGTLVGGLSASSFSLYENGCEVKFKNFEGMESDRPVDVVVIMDTTGSMGKEINDVKNAVVQFVENLRLGNRNARLALVTFGDSVRAIFKSNGDARQFQEQVASLSASGGGDDDSENVLEALNAALNLNFREKAQRVFILVTDAPFHERDAATPLTSGEIADKMRAAGVMFVSISPDFRQYHQLVDKSKGKLHKLFQVKKFEELFESIGVMTAKQYQFTYTGSTCAADAKDRVARIRARREFVWSANGRPETADVADMVVDQGNPQITYMATRDAGLFKSSDNGATWLHIGGSLPESSFENIIPVTGEGGRLVARSRTGRLYLSRDYGETWQTSKNRETFTSVIVAPNKPNGLYATEGQRLYTSDDGGETWQSISQIAQAKGSISLAVDPNRNAIVALGQNEEAKYSEDGGGTWLPMEIKSPEPKASLADFRYYRPREFGGAMYLHKPGGNLYRSPDSGASWEVITPAVADGAVVSDVRFDPSNRRIILASTSRGIFSSDDGGNSWLSIAEGMEKGDAANPLIAFAPGGAVAVAGKRTGKYYNLHSIKDREFISGNVYFATGSAVINDSLYGYLNQLVRRLSDNASLGVRIDGHTDDVGRDDTNRRLSLLRAGSVKEYLVARGIASGRIVTAGHGKTRPIAPNNSPQNRAKNRRMELTLIGK